MYKRIEFVNFEMYSFVFIVVEYFRVFSLCIFFRFVYIGLSMVFGFCMVNFMKVLILFLKN